MPSDLTPRWCDLCRMYVPLEREPHISPEHRRPHRATHLTQDEAEDEAEHLDRLDALYGDEGILR